MDDDIEIKTKPLETNFNGSLEDLEMINSDEGVEARVNIQPDTPSPLLNVDDNYYKYQF